MHDQLGERKQILVAGSILLMSSPPWVIVKTAQFMMGMTVPNSKLEVSLHSTNWIKFGFSKGRG